MTSQPYNIECCTAHPVTYIQTNSGRIFLRVINCLLLDESHPPIVQLFPLIEDKGDERSHGFGPKLLVSLRRVDICGVGPPPQCREPGLDDLASKSGVCRS